MVANIRIVPPATAPRPARDRQRPEGLAGMLVSMGVMEPADVPRALAMAARQEARLADILYAEGLASADELLEAQARLFGTRVVDPRNPRPDPRMIDLFGAHRCLAEGLVPWRTAGGAVVIATARPEAFERHRAELTRLFGTVAMCIAAEEALHEAVLDVRANALSRRAETRVPASESCRDWPTNLVAQAAVAGAGALVFGAALAPQVMLVALTLWAVLTMIAGVALKGVAAAATLIGQARATPAPPEQPQIARLPCVSVMVPLFHETGIAARLIQRLGRIDYPRALLDIVLVVEEEDLRTREALRRHGLPRWMRVVTAPAGCLKTKPRALNYALDLCRGSIVGIWDAEDAPAPDQIHRVVRRFHARGSELACLQGRLDYYNPRTNWLSRCFTIEYATWFRLVLPGLERLGLAIPLGGTTLFFRRTTIEALGGWDAHNVTEDADLGMRLARHGYRCEMIETTTGEEANCRPLPWIRQRSRWIKGYMMTWAVHMRRPRQTLAQLGWWKFAGMQVLFAGSLSQFLLAPLLWSFWLVALGLWHPLAGLPAWMGYALTGLFLTTEAINTAVAVAAVRGPRHRFLIPWVPTLTFYFPMAALAAYKALWELAARPFFWDKTAHGLFDIRETRPEG